MRVLLVEGDATNAASIKLMLAEQNFICDMTDLPEQGLDIGKLYDHDIILLDLPLPDFDDYEALRRLRQARVRTPILILSRVPAPDAKIKTLGFGADDVLTKPCAGPDLIARIWTVVLRHANANSESAIRTGKLVVNLDMRVVAVEDKPVHLTGKEYGILELLSLRKGTPLTKEMFLNHLYGGMREPQAKSIDDFVSKVRKKLAEATGGEGQHYIVTVWGRGYVLRDPQDPKHPPNPAAPPNPELKKWRARDKAKVVEAVNNREITLEEACWRHQLSDEEFRSWQDLYKKHGLPGLRSTRQR